MLAVEQHVHVALFVTLDDAHYDVVQFGAIRVEDRVALGLANTLHDNLLCSLRSDAAEIFGRHFFVVEIARLVISAGLFLPDLQLRIGDFVDDRAAMVHAILSALTVDRDDRVCIAAVIALVG